MSAYVSLSAKGQRSGWYCSTSRACVLLLRHVGQKWKSQWLGHTQGGKSSPAENQHTPGLCCYLLHFSVTDRQQMQCVSYTLVWSKGRGGGLLGFWNGYEMAHCWKFDLILVPKTKTIQSSIAVVSSNAICIKTTSPSSSTSAKIFTCTRAKWMMSGKLQQKIV